MVMAAGIVGRDGVGSSTPVKAGFHQSAQHAMQCVSQLHDVGRFLSPAHLTYVSMPTAVHTRNLCLCDALIMCVYGTQLSHTADFAHSAPCWSVCERECELMISNHVRFSTLYRSV